VLTVLHKRNIVVRDVSRGNVVRAKTGSTLNWTLLEFTSVTRPQAKSFSMAPRTCPPEARSSLSFSCALKRPVVIHCGW
jgi:hypothetical protein